MKKKWLKYALTVLSVVVLMLTLSACSVKMSTELDINEDYTGKRVMTTDYFKASDAGGQANVESFIAELKKSAPEDIKVDSQASDGKYKFTFTLEFSSLDDYREKVAFIIGREPIVTLKNQTNNFSSRFELYEDFTSDDLLVWVKNVKNGDKIELKHNGATVKLGDRVYKSTMGNRGQINVSTISDDSYLLESVNIETSIFGADDYSRSVIFTMPKTTYDAVGEQTFKDITPEGGEGAAAVDESDTVTYTIKFAGDLKKIADGTTLIFPGSVMTYDDVVNENAFSVSGTLNEHIDVSGYPCTKTGACNVTVFYAGSGSVTYNTDAIQSSSKAAVTYNDPNTKKYPVLKVTGEKVNNVQTIIPMYISYTMSNVEVETELKSTGGIEVNVIFDYEGTSANSAAELAKQFYDQQLDGMSGASAKLDVDSTGENLVNKLVLSFHGSEENVTKMMNSVLGSKNKFESKSNKGFRFSTTHNIHHNIDLENALSLAGYDGSISYTFTGSGAYCQNVTATTYAAVTGEKTLLNNMLNGKKKLNTFTVILNNVGGRAELVYQANYVNIFYIVIIAVIAIIAIVLFTVVLSLVARKSKAIKQVEHEKKRKVTVENSLALAVIQNNDGSIVPLSNQALVNRPGAVVESRRDDGLDEDDDEPENIWLFSTTLKLLALIAGVFTFFPFVTVSCSTMGSKSLSAFNLMIGGEGMKPYSIAWLLLAVPIIILILLTLWGKLPKLVTAITIAAVSGLNLFLLIQLPDAIKEQITASSEYQDKIAGYSMGWAYSYSLIIYILLAIGAALLILAEVSEKVKNKFK